MTLTLAGGRVVDPAAGTDRVADVHVAEGTIAAIGDAPSGFRAARILDVGGLVVCPGLVDLSARLREPGFEHKATLESELDAACAGGVTSLACPPDTDPPLDEPGLVEMLTWRARAQDRARVYPVGALTQHLDGVEITEMSELVEAGCVAFAQADRPVGDTQVLLRAMQYAATFGYPVWLRPQDAWLGRGGVAHDGEIATRLGLAGIPAIAETVALATLIALARETGARLHVCRLSTAEGVDLVRAAKAAGQVLTADVAIHHVHLCDVDIGWFDPMARFEPPLRGARDREALRRGLADGTIDAIASDHAPVDDDAKQLPFAEASPGATALELLLPLTLKWAAEARIPLPRALATITSRAGAIMNVPGAGRIDIGAAADLCVFDADAPWRVERPALRSQGKNTPYLGLEVQGRVRYALVGGRVVHEA
ncbi:MAG TPA: dihydroorotase [Casimicrobiaceae bacterium]|jgi:dihydroorotase